MKSKFKYIGIRDQLLEEAVQKQVPRLPSEREICRRFGVSRNTARKSLKSLHDQNLVTRGIGKGTFLNSSHIRRKVQILTHLHESITSFFVKELSLLSKEMPEYEFELIKDTQHGLIKRIHKREPGIKIMLSSHFGYLIAMRQLFPLNEIPGFQNAVSEIVPDFLEWHDLYTGLRQCHSIPLYLDVPVLGYNRKYAEKLKLDVENGPRDWDEMINWSRTAETIGLSGMIMARKPTEINTIPPISFFTALANGRRMLEVNSKGYIEFNFTTGADWINYFKKLVSPSITPPTTEEHQLIEGNCLFAIDTGAWARKYHNDIVFKPLPSPTPIQGGRIYPRISCFGMALIDDGLLDTVSREAAIKIMGKLASQSVQNRIKEDMSRLSVNTHILAEQKQCPSWSPFVRSLESGIIRNDHPLQHAVTRTLQKYFFPAVFNDIPLETTVEKINDICNMMANIENDQIIF